jgi:aminoglycoside 2'-N-acetyltransferase I
VVSLVSMTTAAVPPGTLAAVRRLLHDAFDGTFTDDDWDHALGGWHAVVTDGQEVVAHAAVVPRDLEVGDVRWRCGYVEAVATASHRRGEGLGSQAMGALHGLIRGRFELGVLSTDAHGFYERLGWVRWRGPTYVREGPRLRRTADEDDGIMVLRVGAASDLDLTSPLACRARPGDDW